MNRALVLDAAASSISTCARELERCGRELAEVSAGLTALRLRGCDKSFAELGRLSRVLRALSETMGFYTELLETLRAIEATERIIDPAWT